MRQIKSIAATVAIYGLGVALSSAAQAEDILILEPIIIEIAGADDSGSADPDALRQSGTNMIPASESAPSRNPLQPQTPAAPPASEPALPEPTTALDAGADEQKAAPAAEANQQPTPAVAPTPAAASTEPTTEPTVTAEIFDGIYFRIDGGYALTGDPDASGRNGTNTSTEIDNTGVFGIGIGMPVDVNMRADITASYRPTMSISGRDGLGNAVSSDVTSYSTFLNLYYDFNQVHDVIGTSLFTPYLGAGVGLSALSTDSLSTVGGPTEEGEIVYNLTYAAMAGVATTLSDSITFDLGYRFANLGEFEHDGKFSTGINAAATKYDSLFSHEFRAGLRFDF